MNFIHLSPEIFDFAMVRGHMRALPGYARRAESKSADVDRCIAERYPMTSAILAVDRTNTILNELDILQFKTKLRGRIVLPCDLGYSNARKVWNGMVDKKPAM